jgi:ADP-ribose pyrophosphatase YjhB (NUDIX family)
MKRLNIAIGLIEQDDEYLLQFRNGAPSIGGAGLTGCFGGKVEENENPAEAVAREVGEETSLQTKPSDWQRLGTVRVASDYKNEPIDVYAEVFYIKLPPETEIVATEGELVRIKRDADSLAHANLTPATAAAFRELL